MCSSNKPLSPCVIAVGARPSPLSKAQVEEVLKDLLYFHPYVEFKKMFVKTTGDLDKKTSLRTMSKTDFFTKEVDVLLLEGKCRIGIHSAKDLPDPPIPGTMMIALTKGVDPADVLVLREKESFEQLPEGAVIATSSSRREESVKQLRPDFQFIDLRGSIEERLELLEKRHADGVVVAEAALIRLRLTHLNRIRLPGMSALLQGQIAILARDGDDEMRRLFSCLDCRNTQ